MITLISDNWTKSGIMDLVKLKSLSSIVPFHVRMLLIFRGVKSSLSSCSLRCKHGWHISSWRVHFRNIWFLTMRNFILLTRFVLGRSIPSTWSVLFTLVKRSWLESCRTIWVLVPLLITLDLYTRNSIINRFVQCWYYLWLIVLSIRSGSPSLLNRFRLLWAQYSITSTINSWGVALCDVSLPQLNGRLVLVVFDYQGLD